ncbi:hypothetical protein CPU12_13815, partial [Malaciobacter molluscorum LMG 25693]
DNELKKINLSIKHFKKALKRAKNKEFKSKIVYMLAKSELALYYINNAKVIDSGIKTNFIHENYIINDYGNLIGNIKGYEVKKANFTYEDYIENGYGKFLNDLKEKYQDTNYYKELLKECGFITYYFDTIDIMQYEHSIKINIK